MNRHLVIVACMFAAASATSRAAEIDFNRDIRPILSENCYHCHGPDIKKREAELRLDTRAGLFGEGENGLIIVPGKADKSDLIRRIHSSDKDEQMPPPDSKLSLSDKQRTLLRAWIDSGADWRGHWSFESIKKPAVPKTGGNWAHNEIDQFVLSRLKKEALSPLPAATKQRLLRRASFDLTGLPPTLADLDAFLADKSPSAYEKAVDRLLASPSYGERMAWDWLDAARYADSNGFQGDNERTMWPWRTWVIRAFNSNLPFDRFTTMQLAGDLLPKATPEDKLATGFCRNHMINGEGGRIAEENRIEYLFDQTETMGTVWLGLTLTCCRCHDHKYDPLTQREYYGLVAFFNQTSVNGGGGNPRTPPVIDVVPFEKQDRRTELEKQLATITERVAKSKPVDAKLKAEEKKIRDQINATRKGAVKVMVMKDSKPRKTFMLNKGVYSQPTKEVTFSFPVAVSAIPGKAKPPKPANRLDLAKWLVDPKHPLTARVTVNRHWQKFFGNGLVKTAEDFGAQGEKPTHPQLLDALAADLIAGGWDIKALHKKIVMSATYRQTAKATAEAYERDPENRQLARGPRSRLPSWMIRDQALAVSSLLVEKIGGPSVKPYQPAGVWAEATFGKKRYKQDHGDALYRRSLYTYWRRIIGPTIFFDVAKRQTCTVKTARTNTPLHALVTLNDITYVEAARGLAQRVMLKTDTPTKRIEMAFRLCTSRRPDAEESALLLKRLATLQKQYTTTPKAATELLVVGESAPDEKLAPVEHAAYTGLCLLLLNLDETLSR